MTEKFENYKSEVDEKIQDHENKQKTAQEERRQQIAVENGKMEVHSESLRKVEKQLV